MYDVRVVSCFECPSVPPCPPAFSCMWSRPVFSFFLSFFSVDVDEEALFWPCPPRATCASYFEKNEPVLTPSTHIWVPPSHGQTRWRAWNTLKKNTLQDMAQTRERRWERPPAPSPLFVPPEPSCPSRLACSAYSYGRSSSNPPYAVRVRRRIGIRCAAVPLCPPPSRVGLPYHPSLSGILSPRPPSAPPFPFKLVTLHHHRRTP